MLIDLYPPQWYHSIGTFLKNLQGDDMTAEYTALIELGSQLTTLAVKGTASVVNKKIRSLKDEKNIDNLRRNYDEIINEILTEREEAILVAQTYKAELERIVIDDKDIQHLHNTVARIIKIFSPSLDNAETLALLQELISVDTLKTMQLLGFNYKEAIGIPLTKLCAESINKWGIQKSQKKIK